MFLINLTYIKPISEIEKYIDEHNQLLDQKYNEGIFICSGRKNPRVGGIILAKTVNREIINDFIESDPFHREGLADYEVIEFNPTKASSLFYKIIESA